MIGNFNPAIFHPEWFDRFKILPSHEIKWAEGEKPKLTRMGEFLIAESPKILVKNDLAELFFPSLHIRVNPARFEISSNQRDKFPVIKDVSKKIFTILPHTPISFLGNNFHGHWKFSESGDSILRNLFAKDEGRFQKAMGENYRIRGTVISQKEKTRFSLSLELSEKLIGGIAFDSNFHTQIETQQADEAVQLLSDNFESELGEVINVLKELLGEPQETWKEQPQE